ncbi:MAG TPA: methyltransferase domain-containing protein [Thermoanaerobaculia bacterium]|nr:methyltransferase domain-containing protein [Thermoanaerobaculia bacterium]
MRNAWDRRARRDARRFIECGHSGSEDAFWSSGRRDLDDLVLQGLMVEPSAAVLEIGCGIGRLLKPLSERVAQAIGVDISGEMIRLGREALSDRPNVRLERTEGDLTAVTDGSVDLVYSHIVFQHVPTRAAISRYFAEAARVLKPGGVFRFQLDGRRGRWYPFPDTWHGVRYAAGALRREIAAVGFEVVDLTGEGTQYMWVTARRSGNGGSETRAVRVERRRWDADALDRLLVRLGRSPSADRGRVESGSVSLKALSGDWLEEHDSGSPVDFVSAAYRAVLGREPDANGLAFYAGQIEGGLPREHMLDCLLASAELDRALRPAVSMPSSDRP